MPSSFDIACMTRALELAARGEGYVEPNPMVGCVIARDDRILAEGWHQRYGGPHAEIVAIDQLPSRSDARGSTIYVTLEPCCHHGKTPPCVDALLAVAPARVVVAMSDPFPEVSGGGIAKLQVAGIAVEVGLLAEQAEAIAAPYLKLVRQARPWTIAKWAMTLDGKLATSSGDSRWISSEVSRQIVHELRGRMDAIIVGRGTAVADDPLLTARPPGARTPLRIVLDSQASLSLDSQLVKTANDVPLLIAVGPTADPNNFAALTAAGCRIWQDKSNDRFARLANLWSELGRQRLTNVLVEGGATLLGSLFDARLIDEVHVFIAPKLAGGAQSPSPIAGMGVERMAEALKLIRPEIRHIEGDIYVRGRVNAAAS